MMEDDLLIEQYLKGTLTDEEYTAFLKRLESDPVFNEQVQLETQMLNALGETYWSFANNTSHARVEAYKQLLESEETTIVKSTISTAHRVYKQEQESKSEATHAIFNLRTIASIAAVLVIFVSVFWFSSVEEVDYKAIANKAWNKDVGLDFTVRNATTDSTKVNLAKALQLYKHQEYSQALATLQRYTKTSAHYKDILVVRALSYHKLQQTPIAFQTLDSLATYAPKISKWYKGLIYLENNELEKAALYIHIPSKSNQEIKLK
jgi:uncharacterized membrane protein